MEYRDEMTAKTDQTRSLQLTIEPSPTRKPSAGLKRIILELGLRYRPARADQLEGHQAKIAALISDLIDVPLEPLEFACRSWARRSQFMPKASDLIDLAREAVKPPEAAHDAQSWCDQRNATLERNKRAKPADQVEWFVSGTRDAPEVKLRYSATRPDGPPYCTPEEAREILRSHPSSFARSMLAAIEARDR